MTDREIINYIPVFIYGLEYNPALGPQTGGIAYCNKSTLEFTNYTEQEIVGMGFGFFREILHPDDLYKTSQTISVLLNSDLNEHYEYYRVKDRIHSRYVIMKVFCRIIRPLQKNKNVKFVVTTIKASYSEISQYFPNINPDELILENYTKN